MKSLPCQHLTPFPPSTPFPSIHPLFPHLCPNSDPVLKVFIEHTLEQERQNNLETNYLRRSNDLALNDEHIFLTNSAHPINADIIHDGLQNVVSQWMKKNSFAQLDDEASDDEPDDDRGA
jgi:hypothetical protein